VTISRVPGAEARAGRFPGPSLIPDLHAIQREQGWLPREELVKLSRERRRPLYEIEGLISFNPHFLTSPPAAAEVACCHDLSCWLRGSDERLEELRADPRIELHEVSCIGRCDRAPAATSDRLGQVALGPAISVLGLNRGATEARPQPRPARPPDQTTGQMDGAPDSPDGAAGS
jgi:formate dehydrogenase beta subunit